MAHPRSCYSQLNLYNSMTHKKELFHARDGKAKAVKIFTCGPSIYQRAHIGNYRTFIFEDILIRYLEYLGYKVNRVLNFTDVEDKAVTEAKKQGKDIKELTDRVANKFFEESNLLRLKTPTHNPRSSTSVDQAVKLIKELLNKGIAYWYNGDVYYDPLKFPGFGRLYGLDMSLWPKKKKRFKKDTYPGMRWNLGDFILWHGCQEGENVCWDKELGSGRPSWNVQDPAMATKYLGFKIDIACGGIDNLCRHHDYNIAVAEGVSGEEFAPFWLHGAHLFVYGKKMSKSIGNIVYIEDLLKDGYTPEHVRFFLIYGHYRERLNFTRRQFQESAEKLDDFRQLLAQLTVQGSFGTKANTDSNTKNLIDGIIPHFEECMNNDLDVFCTIDDLFEALAKLTQLKSENRLTKTEVKHIVQDLKKIDSVFQVIFPKVE
ncbi:class I tRNA ligase family protein [[Eubacterium] cellulosolvens]